MGDKGDSLFFPIRFIDENEERIVFLSDLAIPIFEEYFRKMGWNGEWRPPFITVDLTGKTTKAKIRTKMRRIFIVTAFSEIEEGEEFGTSLFELLDGIVYKKNGNVYRKYGGSEYFHVDDNDLVVIEEKE